MYKVICIIIEIKPFLKYVYTQAYIAKNLCWLFWKYLSINIFHVACCHKYYRKHIFWWLS